MTFQYQTQGTCSRAIHIELDGDIIRSVSFDGGCNGNLKGICQLEARICNDSPVSSAESFLRPRSKKAGSLLSETARLQSQQCLPRNQQTPCASIASATLVKPAMFAPTT